MKQIDIMTQLYRYQKKLKMTSVEVSEKSGIHVNTYYNMRSGKQNNSFSDMERVANTLGLELVLTFKKG